MPRHCVLGEHRTGGENNLDAVHIGSDLLELAVASRGEPIQELCRRHYKLVDQRRRHLVVDGRHLREGVGDNERLAPWVEAGQRAGG